MKTDDTTRAAALLDAGAILRPGTVTRDDADALTARTYTHPALDDRRVVRLVAGTLGDAEDLALDFLGLVREPETPEVGQVRRETLGFPAWALVNDPANGHHALALVKDMERLARQAKSRAGAAKDGFEALATRLGRAVPHFLPTFYEQAARVFLQHDNSTYAATLFGKARAAERVHGLAVDEDRQRAVFLEFAFAGALTVKALKDHAQDLSRRLDPAEAWAQFRRLAVERCAAGMPPYAALPQDARGLIKAAGLDRLTAESAFVADLLASPSIVRAPASFWTAYRATLVTLAAGEPAVRARLLEILPTGLGNGRSADESWLGLLAETGADTLLTEETGTAGTDPADWLSRWALHRKHGSSSSQRCAVTLALVERMTPRLRSDGRPVDLFQGRWHAGADLDLLDACLAWGIPLTEPAPGAPVHLPLEGWLTDDAPGRRDLTAVAGRPRFRGLLHHALSGLNDHRAANSVLDAIAAHPVLSEVLHDWLRDRAEEFTGATGLPGSRAALSRIARFRPVAARVNAAAVARVGGHDLAPVLAATLRAGIVDELGWPALEEVYQQLDSERADRNHWVMVAEAWPALIVANRNRAVVVGPEGVLLEHDLRLPVDHDQWRRPHFRYTDGELLVIWYEDSKQRAYWSGRPSEVFTLGGEQLPYWWSAQTAGTPSLPLPGGGRATGGRTLHAGDTTLPSSRPVLGDGTGYWRQGKQGREPIWVEYDPAGGTHGRASLPAFLQSGIREDARLVQQDCEVLPLMPGLENTPFGTDGTVLGRWVRTEGRDHERRVTAGTPDGRTVTLPVAAGPGHHPVPLGVLRLPGGAGPVAAQVGNTIQLHPAHGTSDAAGVLGSVSIGEQGGEYAAGTAHVPPPAFWHALRPRDEQGSAALRAVTDTDVEALLSTAITALEERRAAAAAARETYTGPSEEAVVRTAVAAALPVLSDPRLLTGVTAIVRAAVNHVLATTRFVTPVQPQQPATPRTEGMFAQHRPAHGDDATLRAATTGIAVPGGYMRWGQGEVWTALQQILAVNQVLSGKPADGKPLPEPVPLPALGDGWNGEAHTVPGVGMVWLPFLNTLRPLAYRAASPSTSAEHREALLTLLEAVAAGPLADPPGALREVILCEEDPKRERVGQVLRRGGRTVVILGRQNTARGTERIHWLALDHDPEGAFGKIADFTLHDERRHDPAFPHERLLPLIRLIREQGATAWRPEAAVALDTATGIGPAQATLLIAAATGETEAAGLSPLGLKTRQAERADHRLNALGRDNRLALLDALLPADPAELWAMGPDIDAAVHVWAERLGSLVRLPEDLADVLHGVGTDAAEAVLNPARTAWLSRTTTMRRDKDGDLVPDDPSALPGRGALTGAVAALSGLAYGLPYGHPLRAHLPAGLAAVRRRLADPGLVLDLDVQWTDKGTPTAAALRTAYSLPASGGAGPDGLTRVGDSLLLRPWYADIETTLVRTAGLTGADDPVFGLLEGLLGPSRTGTIASIRVLLGSDLEQAVNAGTGPDDVTGYAQDPTRSVPGLVTEVAAAHALSEDAAALYLQLLALPDPTDRDCARWTGWKPARLKKARTELAATDLVLEAKRSRAGRSLFLPCGWHDFKSPALPVETWKEGLYPLSDYARARPHLPVPALFALAWGRVQDGDAPAFEELTTRATRKGRRR
ncbi:hypothetical protein [Streptomyces sp. SPB162]|uniref:hypothetical protein n=1 Tax=Streptomyces sp. SPB162 TaxID=2940560 RepID=UPI002405B258|nr:hypothetical protein [Streptomyces sp. SPB162]MDF9811357.1 hypothetical protein [Streptomyces sp. SPB162]